MDTPAAPNETTKPPLTAEQLQAAKDTSTPVPGAGGWTPTVFQRLLISSGAAAATASLDMLNAPVLDLKAIARAAGLAAVIYFVAHFGTLSAGTREVTK